MRKIVAGFACSVDGYIEGPNGAYDWILIDKEMDFAEQAKRFDTYLFGRKSYEAVLAMGNAAFPGASSYVFSHTLASVDSNFTLIKGDLTEQVMKIKQREGKDIALYGGASLLAGLLNARLVDEFIVTTIPVLLGQGKPMVGLLTEAVQLSLLNYRHYANGTLQAGYAVNYRGR